ncbi:hypothetical protein BC833DRAFT_616062 [Globomyces pollinis-pini]|nr:hypothetical protein BC833DRAFT_616062 [Globomyces pollinis-pini]
MRCKVLHTHTCYDLLSPSFKVIVFDCSLLVKKALAALLQHGVQAAPVWDSRQQKFVGMLTVTDFIQLILYYFDQSSSVDEALLEIDELTIGGLRDLERDTLKCLPNSTITIQPLESLYNASRLLIKNHLHRLPLLESTPKSDTIISVLTQNKILRFIAAHETDSELMNRTLKDIGIGTFKNLITETPLIDILKLFIRKRISSVPIVDKDGHVTNVYEKYDVLMLAKGEPFYNLDMPVCEALLQRSQDFTGIYSCCLTDTLGQVLMSIKSSQVRRFVILEDNKLKGLLSLSDILGYLIG